MRGCQMPQGIAARHEPPRRARINVYFCLFFEKWCVDGIRNQRDQGEPHRQPESENKYSCINRHRSSSSQKVNVAKRLHCHYVHINILNSRDSFIPMKQDGQ